MKEKAILSEAQIQSLYRFTRAHFVYHYDLQTELVDHMAEAIEELQEKQPELTFDDATKIVFKSFGVFGFQDIVQERMQLLTKRYWRLIWSLFKTHFKWPLLLRTVSITILVFCFLKGFYIWFEQLLLGVLIAAFVLIIFRQIKIRRQIKKRQKESGKKWMFETIISQLGGAGSFLIVPFHLGLESLRDWSIEGALNTSLKLGILSFLLVVVSITLYLILFSIPNQLQGHLKTIYPEYSLV